MSDPYLDESGDDDGGGAPGWLTTWSDMMSVLLTFFIVLQAFSTLNERKFFEAMSSIQRAFQMPLPIRSPGSRTQEGPSTADKMEAELEQDSADDITVQDFGDRIVLTVNSELLFHLGKAQLTPAGEKVMGEVAKALTVTQGAVRVEGHTCDLPLGPGSEYHDNWDLSTARALTALHELTRRGIPPERLSAVGYGEYHPIAPNDSEVDRRKNRRVEFVIEKGIAGADDYDAGG